MIAYFIFLLKKVDHKKLLNSSLSISQIINISRIAFQESVILYLTESFTIAKSSKLCSLKYFLILSRGS